MDIVRNNDSTALIKKYQAGDHPVLRRLLDGSGVVIGDAADEHNRLLYVIKRGNSITVEYAEGVRVAFDRRPGPAIRVKVAAGTPRAA